ncbi:MAG TPA: sensor histidine kinase [Candidatus Agrococcus pullicola]|uniref:histidine kinase n=1 Tax=Candidatus Agrococcus pullicola TaxID=2838429 RepID=A0A9D1YWJ0_9MICO|nr:sensor histidine kinase [Candidatus Agrococcus pullicola]
MTTQQEEDRLAPWVVDTLIAGGVVVVLGIVIALSQADAGETPSLLAYAFAAGFGAVLLVRRRFPLTVLTVSVLGMFLYYILEFPAIGVALPVTAALFSAAEAGRTRWSIAAGAFVFAVSLFFRIRDDPQPLGYLLGLDSVVNLGLIAAAIALGFGIRSRRISVRQQRQITRLTREQVERSAELRVQSERERISRELHDSIGHSLSVISLHAGAGGESVGRDDEAVAAAFERIRDQSTASLSELRSLVRLLRADRDGDDGRHVHTLEDIETVLEEGRSAGIRVESRIDIGSAALSPTVDVAAYRVVQESITNTIRHAKAQEIKVGISIEHDSLLVSVADDGAGSDLEEPSGYGIAGMAERVRLLGGTFEMHTAPGEGFTVNATMPVRLTS